MFKISPPQTFKATVKIPSPGGEVLDLCVLYKHRTRDQLKVFWEDATAGKQDDLHATLDMIAGWEGVDAEFSEAALADLLQNYHGAAAALFSAYIQELTQARLGN
jgi:hypothetical protein